MGRGPKFIPRPFSGTNAPPGASPEALRELQKMQRADNELAARSAPPRKPSKPPPASAQPSEEDEDDLEDADEGEALDVDTSSDHAQPRRAARGAGGRGRGRPAKEDRVQRAVRLTPALDAKLRQLAEFRGIDLNAAVSVAIVEDWRRCFGSRVDRS